MTRLEGESGGCRGPINGDLESDGGLPSGVAGLLPRREPSLRVNGEARGPAITVAQKLPRHVEQHLEDPPLVAVHQIGDLGFDPDAQVESPVVAEKSDDGGSLLDRPVQAKSPAFEDQAPGSGVGNLHDVADQG